MAAQNNWNSASAGNLGTQQWSDGNAANFAAGTDGTGSYTVTASNASRYYRSTWQAAP